MIDVIQSETFRSWLKDLRDRDARNRILARLVRIEDGNFGDTAPVGEGVSELRFHFGPGYRIYYMQDGPVVVILLCGGDKSTQRTDITTAKRLAKEWKEETR